MKLELKMERGRFVLVHYDMPDPEEAKRLWREGKSAQYILEQARKKAKLERKER